MHAAHRIALAAAIAALALAPAPLRAQVPAAGPAPAADSMAFPRQFVQWVFAGQGDSAYAHAGPRLRESMQSPQGVSAMASRILGRFGAMEGTSAEAQFADGPLLVYIAALKFPDAPEPGAFVVAYDPATRVVDRASFGSLANARSRFPQARLP